MKLQHQAQTLRFRIDEAELAVLLAGGNVGNLLELPGGAGIGQSLALAEQDVAVLGGTATHWRVWLPRAATQAYCQRLPCREGLEFRMPAPADGAAALRVIFEVDVRDSKRVRVGTARALAAHAPVIGELRSEVA